MAVRMTLTPTNGSAVADKLRRFASAVLDSEKLRRVTEPLVASEYERQFATQGAYFGKVWRGSKTSRVLSLVKSGDFQRSFSPTRWQFAASSDGKGVVMLSIRNPHSKSGMSAPLIQLLEEWSATQVQIRGPQGGISGSGASRLHNLIHQFARGELSRAGFKGAS